MDKIAALMCPAAQAEQLVLAKLLPQYIEWAHGIEAEGLEIGILLNTENLKLAKDIGIKSPEKVRVVSVVSISYPYANLALKAMGETLGLLVMALRVMHRFSAIRNTFNKKIRSINQNWLTNLFMCYKLSIQAFNKSRYSI